MEYEVIVKNNGESVTKRIGNRIKRKRSMFVPGRRRAEFGPQVAE